MQKFLLYPWNPCEDDSNLELISLEKLGPFRLTVGVLPIHLIYYISFRVLDFFGIAFD